ncbi:hypothetical protein [Roseivivax sp. CAU 1761]
MATGLEDAMLDEIAETLTRSRRTVLQDSLGVLALGVMLYAALHI